MAHGPVIHTGGNGGLPPEKLEILRELEEAFGGNREAISIYLSQFGWSKVVAPNIRLVKREMAEKAAQVELSATFTGRLAAGQKAPVIHAAHAKSTTSDAEGAEKQERSPYYEVEVTCPFCVTRFMASAMRSKSLVISYTYRNFDYPLLVPESTQAMAGYHLEDPLQRAVIVCPKCLYASSSLSNFSTESAVSGARSIIVRLPERKLRQVGVTLAAATDERRALCGSILAGGDPNMPGLAFQKDVRNPDELITSFRLAALCESTLGEYDVHQNFKACESMLAAAKIAWEHKRPDEERRFLQEALQHVDRCYQQGSATALPVYILGVLHWHLDNPTQARTWIGQILVDRGKLGNASKFKRYAEALNEQIKAKTRSGEA